LTSKTIKTVLFAGIITAIILPFSGMDFAEAKDDANKKRNYVEEWQVIDKEVEKLVKDQDKDVKALSKLSKSDKVLEKIIEKRGLDIEALNQKINDLEQESINSLKMPDGLESKLFAAELDITQNYANLDKNPIWGAAVNYELQKVVVYVDADNNASDKITKEIIKKYGDLLVIEDKPKLIACTSPISSCTPLIGGIALARDNNPTHLAGTLGYKARDATGNTGFVTAAHVVDYCNPNCTGNTWMRQPYGSNPTSVGYATIVKQGMSQLDTAFVKTTVSIDDNTYQSSNQSMDATSYASSGDHKAGVFVYSRGTTSGEMYGSIDAISSSGWYGTTMSPQEGDSGGPIYKKTGGAGGTFTTKIYGHMFGAGGIYTSVHIVAQYGITPLLS
jgi:hypothetical protein